MSNNKTLIFIPARAGSKRLANKNIKLFLEKPLIFWTIKSALACNFNMDVIVSTECPKIAMVAKKLGAEVPFLRPESMATDGSESFESLKYTILKLAEKGRHYKFVIFLQPTSPLRQTFHIEEALQKLIDKKAKSVVSVSEAQCPTKWIMSLDKSDDMSHFINTNFKSLKTRSQKFSKEFRLNGAIYCGRLKDILKQGSFYVNKDIYAYKMEQMFSVDIDEAIDFEYAEFLMEKYRNNNEIT